MAQEVAIAGSPARAKLREPVGVWLLSLITLGIYSWFWWYYINRELRDLGRARGVPGLGDNPGLSCAALVLGGFTLYIATVWTVVTTTQRIQRAQQAVGITDVMSGWVAGLLWVFTLGIGGVIYTQSQLNKVWRTQPQAIAPDPIAGPAPTADADLERLKKLSELRESGAISPEEFETEKGRLLPQQSPAPPPSGPPVDAPPPAPDQMPVDAPPPEQD